jgi:hypothetical protein
MKRRLLLSCWAVLTLLSANSNRLRAAEHGPGYVEVGQLAAAEGGEFVEVVIRSYLISMAARLTEKEEPEIAAILRNLEFVRVNVVGLNDKNRDEIQGRIRSINERLDADGWERVVTVKDGHEQVNVHMKTRGEESVLGLLVTVLDGSKEAIFVNVVGDIKPEQLAVIGDRFNIEPLKKLKKELKKEEEEK